MLVQNPSGADVDDQKCDCLGTKIPATIARRNPIEREESNNRKCCRDYRFLLMVAKWWFVTWPLLQVGRYRPTFNVS
jgi:hypothetical protein